MSKTRTLHGTVLAHGGRTALVAAILAFAADVSMRPGDATFMCELVRK